jgi:hypothetical protein
MLASLMTFFHHATSGRAGYIVETTQLTKVVLRLHCELRLGLLLQIVVAIEEVPVGSKN